jgi:hypothetical protein
LSCPVSFPRHLARVGIACLAGLIAMYEVASAQFATGTPTQSDLMRLPVDAQGAQLAEVVRRTSQVGSARKLGPAWKNPSMAALGCWNDRISPRPTRRNWPHS